MGRLPAPFDPSWRRVGVLGGAFDPPHAGHVALARAARDDLGLDAVVLVPAARPPHKDAPVAPFRLRLAMAEAAAAGEDRLHASGLEAGRPGPSYSVDTLKILRKWYGVAVRLFFLVGYDAFLDMGLWKQHRLIPELAGVAVAPRDGLAFCPERAMAAVFPDYRRGDDGLWRGGNGGVVRFLTVEVPGLSSTVVRRRIAAGEEVSGLLPPRVIEVLEGVPLYRERV